MVFNAKNLFAVFFGIRQALVEIGSAAGLSVAAAASLKSGAVRSVWFVR